MSALERAHRPELMDRPDVDPAALEQGLGDLRRVNRWLGGRRAALGAVLPVIRAIGIEAGAVRVLDVGTGSADIPLALARRARREGLWIRVLATDLHPETVAAAGRLTRGEPSVEVARANGLALDYPAGAFHVAMCHTMLHHFEGPEACRLLSELGRVASSAVVVTDLARGRAALGGVRLLAATLWRHHPVTRHDGLASVRGAYTPREALELARRAGLPRPEIRNHPLFRYSLVARLDGEAA